MKHKKISLDIDTQDILEKVYKLTSLWVSRSDEYPFYTLGRSAYLDGKTKEYYAESEWQNELLAQNFYGLYSKLLDSLAFIFDETVILTEDLAIPGFHIFPSDPTFIEKNIAGNWHQDFPHVTLGAGIDDAYAYTVAIALPRSGGGMEYITKANTVAYLPYKRKELILHDGLTFHRIAGLKEYVPNEYRITLQGHIIRRNGQLETFW